MAKLPTFKQIKAEQFPDLKWMPALLAPINAFCLGVYQALNRRLTVNDNLAGELRQVEVDGAYPLKLSWSLTDRPVAVTVAGVTRKDGAPPLVVNATADTTSTSSTIVFESADGVAIGMLVAGAGIPTGTRILSLSGTTATLSVAATATASDVALSLTIGAAVQVAWSFDGSLTVDAVYGIAPAARHRYLLTLLCLCG